MRAYEFILNILREVKEAGSLDVRIDSGIPVPLEKVFDIKLDKGFLLLIPKLNSEICLKTSCKFNDRFTKCLKEVKNENPNKKESKKNEKN